MSLIYGALSPSQSIIFWIIFDTFDHPSPKIIFYENMHFTKENSPFSRLRSLKISADWNKWWNDALKMHWKSICFSASFLLKIKWNSTKNRVSKGIPNKSIQNLDFLKVLAPQTLPKPHKIPSKSMFQKTWDFSGIFARKKLSCKSVNINKTLVFSNQNGSRTFFFASLFAWIFKPKNHPKTSQKPCPDPSKIDAENVLFFNIVFFGFGPRFWRVLGLEVGAKLAIFAKKLWDVTPFLPS